MHIFSPSSSSLEEYYFPSHTNVNGVPRGAVGKRDTPRKNLDATFMSIKPTDYSNNRHRCVNLHLTLAT